MLKCKSNPLKESTICKTDQDSDASSPEDYLQEVTTDTINESIAVVGDDSSSQEVATNAVNERQAVVELRRKVKHLQRLLRLEKKKVGQFECNLNRFLNDDQVQQLKLKAGSAKAAKWSDKTVTSSLEMRSAIGAKGYDYLRNEGYPLPSYRTLCYRLEMAQFEQDNQQDVVELLKMDVDSLPSMGGDSPPSMGDSASMGGDCILTVDEIQPRPTFQYHNGTLILTG